MPAELPTDLSAAPSDLCQLSISELAPLIRQRKLSPVELAEAVLARIAALNDTLLAFCTIDPEAVRAQARRAEAQLMADGPDTPRSPLFGIPFGIKDLIFTNDLVSTGGSTAYRDFVPDEDDVVVERLRAAGALILGKTNVPEFGMGFGSRNPVFGATRNPWNLDKTPGGSSGGSAVAVVTGMGPGALGSDGGGSIRTPSSYCGTYGIKPTFGRIPLYPGCRDTRYPGFSGWESLEHLGPITRTVTDAALMLDVLVGPDRRDRHSIPREIETFANLDPASVAGLRIAWTTDFGGYARVDVEVKQAVEAAARQFEALGARVEQATPFTDDPSSEFLALVALDFDVAEMRKLAAAQPDSINARIAGLLAREWTFEEVSSALTLRRALYNQVWRFFERYDLLLTPTTPTAAFDLMLGGPLEIGGVPLPEGTPPPSFTSPFNMTGGPAASIPAGWTADGLPIGLQIVGGHLADQLVLRASRAYEQASPWLHLRPPV
jgi:aspartyl-tRNA(Asn)/glutamyl-tRNA(Gln) amidotransferase subunit A